MQMLGESNEQDVRSVGTRGVTCSLMGVELESGGVTCALMEDAKQQ